MKWIIVALFAFVLFSESNVYAAPAYAYRVTFKDKNGTMSFADSLQFLSPKALQRRSFQGIPLDSTDLPVVQAYIDTVMVTSNALRLHAVSKWFNQIVIICSDSMKRTAIEALPMVASVRLVARFGNGIFMPTFESLKFPEVTYTPNALKTTGSSAYYGLSYHQVDMIQADCLHDLGFRGESMDIAVLDINFRYTNTCLAFDSLRQQQRIKDVYNFCRDTAWVYNPGIPSSHGMNVLGCMAANLPGTYVGTAPYANYFLYITEDNLVEQPIEEDNWLSAAERADSAGVFIINSSLGYNKFDAVLSSQNYTYAHMDGQTSLIARAANKAVSKGIFVVNAQGNEGFSAWHYLLTPADADSVYSVGMVDGSGIWGGSGYGPSSDGQIKPDGMALGKGAGLIGDNCQVGFANGSSFAAPIMSGAIACLWQAVPSLPVWKLRNIIRMSSDRYNNVNDTHGYGIPNFCTAFGIATGTADVVSIDHRYAIFPNPGRTDEFQIKAYEGADPNYSIRIYSIGGRLVYEDGIKRDRQRSVQLPSSLAPGSYFILISTTTRQFSSTWVKMY
jgi:hypothetical protein